MNQNKKLIIISSVILFIFLFYTLYDNYQKKKNRQIVREKLKTEKFTKEIFEEKLDLNSAYLEEMLEKGISFSIGNKIIDYREDLGAFSSINELNNIKGIGESTYEKIKDIFYINGNSKKKKININKVKDEVLKLYGISKKEIKAINSWKKENGKIVSSIDLKNIVEKDTYEEIKEYIKYD